jgi:hypothetical protein
MSKVCLPITWENETKSHQVTDPKETKELAELFLEQGRFPSNQYSINTPMSKDKFMKLAQIYLKLPEKLIETSMKISNEIMHDYYESIFEQRSIESPNRAGSFYNASPEEIKKGLQDENCIYTIASYNEEFGSLILTSENALADKGRMFGMVDIGSLDEQQKLMVIDPKNTGKISFGLEKGENFDFKKADKSTVIISIQNQQTNEIDPKNPVFITCFPDIPEIDTSPDKVFAVAKGLKTGQKLSVSDIREQFPQIQQIKVIGDKQKEFILEQNRKETLRQRENNLQR